MGRQIQDTAHKVLLYALPFGALLRMGRADKCLSTMDKADADHKIL